MTRVTKAFTQGLKMVGGGNVANYSLQFLSPTQNKKVGDYMTVVVPYIRMGRDPKCQVQFGNEHPTVSRKHAEIERKGKDLILRNISQTNTTLVNGNAIDREWYLGNGDEIQLSESGPKIRFNAVPARTSNIKLTSRMQMFAEQALKPYKTAVAILSVLLGLSFLGGGYLWYDSTQTKNQLTANASKFEADLVATNRKHEAELAKSAADFKKQLEENKQRQQAQIEQLKADAKRQARKLKQSKDANTARIQQLQKELETLKKNPPKPPVTEATSVATASGAASMLASLPCEHVYFVYCYKIEITLDGELEVYVPEKDQLSLWSGTGFMTSDKKFVTARHVIQAWRYNIFDDANMRILNAVESAGNDVIAYFKAISKNGDAFTFTSKEMQWNESLDTVIKQDDITYKYAEDATTDWAYKTMENASSSVAYDRNLSNSLKMGDELHVLGFSYGLATQPKKGQLSPLYSQLDVAQDGLTSGLINTTGRGFGPGNSGGPVFVNKDGRFVVIGIVSAGIGSEIGVIVPISVLR